MSDKSKNCKVVVLGESGVGKTCLITRYVSDTYTETTCSTNGATYASKTVDIDDIHLRFDIWDTAGQEKYRSLTKFFYKDAAIAILVYDITRRGSFEEIKKYWIEQLKTCGDKNVIIGIAGNKSDLFSEEEITESEAQEFATSINAIFNLTSAYQNNGINELFQSLGKKFLDPNYQVNGDTNKSNKIKLDKKKNSNKQTDKKKFC